MVEKTLTGATHAAKAVADDTRADTASRRSGSAFEVVCGHCGLHRLCQVLGLDDLDSELLDRAVARAHPVRGGQLLMSAGDRCHGIYAVKSGAFKVCEAIGTERQHVIGFHLPGEVFGLEAIDGGRYGYSVRALQPSSVCIMSLGGLALDGERLVDFQRQLIRTLSEKMQQDYHCLAAGTQSAEQRVAAFLLNIYTRFARHGLAGTTFRLPMSRCDIADHLGLATATVSRVFQRLRAQRLLAVRGRSVGLDDLERLHVLAGIRPTHPTPAD